MDGDWWHSDACFEMFASSQDYIPTKSVRQKKDLKDLSLQQQRTRISCVLESIRSLSVIENTSEIKIAALALQLLCNEGDNREVAKVSKSIVHDRFSGQFGYASKNKELEVDKALFLLDLLEIGKRKYTLLRQLLLSSEIHFPAYHKVADQRNSLVLRSMIQLYPNPTAPIGVCVPYAQLVRHTFCRIISTLPSLSTEDFPLRFQIADGLDGSGSHIVYNQPNTNTDTKSYILFCFKAVHIVNSSSKELWRNNSPNSPFSQRPIFLLAATENHDNIRQFMNDIINPETDQMRVEGFSLAEGHVSVDIVRSMFDGKMAGILSGAGGASCQLCTATHKELKDRDFIVQGYPINRNISDAIQLFGEVEDVDAFFSLPTNQRFNLTHEPLSTINILPASPLHSYTCIFRWFNLLVYHLNCKKFTWSPSSKEIKESMIHVRTIIQEVTGLRIDQPDPKGGTTSTGGVARKAFSNDSKFIECVVSLVEIEFSGILSKLHTLLSAILRIVNSDRRINTEEFGNLCTDTYLLILDAFPWANVTPSLHKLLAHSEEILREMNSGYGLKCFSEEGSEACNKLIRRYRERLARKTSFEDNVVDIFVRLVSESDPVLVKYRSIPVCEKCGEYGHTRRAKCCKGNVTDSLESSIENIIQTLIIGTKIC